ncbi:D-alanyl-D-alanine carboxypeptidase/D-alanyl-D-alanine-endopeptidase [Massilia sp. CF038]|uniref:D-alanyl-D-alanine carboxypeptidase/D-alanyl-D-alanine endopeptidase n=1 Tax=Massilia sp. CF038 TaxID=1881045 RepID=UPI0009169FCE|nr:D-alanyl-D-alanine carboxypeptidase/D-alanyl-D-alanine-endopeptidase [Massilia sp. CF038]SHH47113.1 D-alanyl-D-alanine carboxypeptidase / D-alanyl-D-alanine-endopeptidase (penicillin-binding protein 4) [Massilia sp. CF038]
MIRPLAFAVLLAWLPAAQAQLPPAFSRALAAAKISEQSVSVLVLRGDKAVLSHQADRQMQPASTIKVVTTLVALEQLTPVFRGRTELRSNAARVGDTLMGDLVLRGGADADLNNESLQNMLQAVRNQGIRRIEGRLVLDRSLFNPARIDQGLPPFDESPDAYYNVIPDALLLNKNMLLLDMRSDEQQLQLIMQPQLDRVTIESGMTLINAECGRWEEGWKAPEIVREASGKIRIILRGTYPKNCWSSNSINVLDRQDYVDRVFREVWERLGGEIAGDTIDGVGPLEARIYAQHVSRALPEIVRDTNKLSDNALARTLFLSLGSLEGDAIAGSKPLPGNGGMTTVARADLAVRSWMRRQGIDDSGMVLDNGSGLSRTERISAQQMGRLLQAGLRSKWAPEFQASLPIAGMDGTMRRRLRDSPAAERARLKTGTVRNVIAIAGYAPDANGQPCVVVAMINGENAGAGRAALDVLVDWVARVQ